MITLKNKITNEVILTLSTNFMDMTEWYRLDVAPPDHHDCVFIDGKWQKSIEQALPAVRRMRNQLMAECDWTQTEDQKTETKNKWKEYRQILRNFPETCQDPFNPIWPEKPE